MTREVIGLVMMAACSVGFSILAVFIFRETRRTVAFDRRLAVPRVLALALAPKTVAGGDRGSAHLSLGALGRAILRGGSMLVPIGAKDREQLMVLLRCAGFAQRDALALFLSTKLSVALAWGAGAGLWATRVELLAQYDLFIGLAAMGGLIVGSIAPEYVLRALSARRSRKMSAALPDALDLMVMGLESGLIFERALSTVAEELAPIEPNLAGEFRLMEAELRLGSNRRVVLQDFYQRTGVEGLRNLAMTLLQSDRYGTPLVQSMKTIAVNERLQRATKAVERTERLPVLMTLPMLLFVVPGTMLLVAGPAFLTAIEALGSLGG